MPYYPKSQIQTDQYTKGGELRVVATKEGYIGHYWKTSKGEYFSGKNPYDGVTLDLEPIPFFPESNLNTVVYSKGNVVYNVLKEVDVTEALLIPSYVKPSPTKQDYEIGNFTRYFAKRNNENLYIETSEDIYSNLKKKNGAYDWKSYLVFTLSWKLTGEESKVLKANQNIILITEQNLKINGLGIYLKNNYLEFYK
jgi:hypothetical protein